MKLLEFEPLELRELMVTVIVATTVLCLCHHQLLVSPLLRPVLVESVLRFCFSAVSLGLPFI